MSSKTITRADLASAVHGAVGLSLNDSGDLVDHTLEIMSDSLAEGAPVKLSSFGSFMLREKGERIGRNPKTGEEVPISPRRVVTFRASHILKDQVNRG
ncbi:MAG: integration host factor subunit alpha [Rhodospirillales bacterium]|nr:integration host factor subunit alpha [Rhodospirillales bacterium]